jgi:hypothetical protein
LFYSNASWLRETFRVVSPKYLQRYLDEFAFRFSRRCEEATPFTRILNRAVAFSPFPCRDLAAEPIE